MCQFCYSLQVSVLAEIGELEAALGEKQAALAQQQEAVARTAALLDQKKGDLAAAQWLIDQADLDDDEKAIAAKKRQMAGASMLRVSMQPSLYLRSGAKRACQAGGLNHAWLCG